MDELRQTINLRNRLGRKPTIDELESFAQEAIEEINQRTLDNSDVSGKAFARYSKEYAEKKGVSRNSVDLFLEGDMLNNLTYDIDPDRGVVEILLTGEEAAKGHGHHTGGGNLPKRRWFGLTPDEVEAITNQVAEDVEPQATTRQQDAGITLADLQAAVGQLFFEED